MVPEALIAFRKLFPNADVHMVEGFGHTLVPKVRDETLEFAIAPRLPEFKADRAIRFRPLFAPERVVVGRRGHPLAGAKSLAELKDSAWLTFEPQALLARDFARHGLMTPRPLVLCESFSGFLRLLETTDMLGIVPRIGRVAALPRFRVFDLQEPLLSLTAGIFTRADSPLTPAAAALLRALVATTARFAKR
jgi:LysR family transcriptional regulator of abg operon